MKRKIIAFVLILALLAGGIFAAAYFSHLKRALKEYVCQRISKLVKREIHIGSISRGLFNDTTLKDVSIIIPIKGYPNIIIMFDKARLNLNLAQFLAGKFFDRKFKDIELNFQGGKIFLAGGCFFAKDLRGKIDFKAQNGFLENASLDMAGKLNLIGRLAEFNARIFSDGKKINVNSLDLGEDLFLFGMIDTETKKFLFDTNSDIRLKGDFSSIENLYAELKLTHVNFKDADISSRIEFEGAIAESGNFKKELVGHLASSESILNLKPFNEFDCRFVIKDGAVALERLEWGEKYNLTGDIALKEPFLANLRLLIRDASVMDLISLFRNNGQGGLSGVMAADIAIDGNLNKPKTKGIVDIKDGRLGDIDFKTMKINLTGDGPLINISDSRVFREKGHLFLEGSADLRNLKNGNLLKGLKIFADDKTLIWEGWDISKPDKLSQVKMEKNVDEKLKVGFKTFMNDENLRDQPKKEEWELQYKIGKEKIKVRLKEEDDFLGLEHKNEF